MRDNDEGVRAAIVLCVLLASASASAETEIVDLAALHAACRAAEAPGRRVLHAVRVARPRFASYDDASGFLPIDTRRNLRVLRGAAEVFPSELESIGFVARPERAAELRAHERSGSLRVGFFLGFDGRGSGCVIRPAAGVTTVRADIAFVELLDESGNVVAREDTDRLSAWLDDDDADPIPGDGPRAALETPTVERGSLSPLWRDALRSEALRAEVSRCYADARSRGHAPDARMYVVLSAEPGGRVDANVMLSTLRDSAATACVAERLSTLPLPTQGVRSTVPIRFVD